MRVVADDNIPYVEEAFAPLGEVVRLPSLALTPQVVRDADLLLIRSTTRAGPALLDGSRVRFLATATIGTDHLDLDWLSQRGIAWAAAPGSNADSVRQWWAQALLTAGERRGVAVDKLQVGIVGVGAVGSRIAGLCRALGPAPLLCDPPRARREGAAGFVELESLLPASDLVTLHVPLARGGGDPTQHLLDQRQLGRLKPGAWLVNASRGEVVDGTALGRAIAGGAVGAALLDVWEHEPEPDPALVLACELATPHIAGHSLEGKAAGTQQIYEAACRFLGVAPTWTAAAALPASPVERVRLSTGGRSDAAIALELLRKLWRIEEDDAALRSLVRAPDAARAFQRYRASYRIRREPRVLTVELSPYRESAARLLAELGAHPQA